MKINPSKQELIEFINQITSMNIDPIKKIQDLSTGAHYLLLLNQTCPGVVKLSKINLKAFQQYESINNLKLLAIYISQLKAHFTFQLTKIAQKSYQDNLNLLKNLHKYHYQTVYKRQNPTEEPKKEQSLEKKPIAKPIIKPKPNIILKGPPKQRKQLKKIAPPNSNIKDILKEMREPYQKINKILEIFQSDQNSQNITAQVKIKKIKDILGVNDKKKQQNNNKNFSVQCSGSKSDRKQSNQFEIDYPKLPDLTNVIKTQIKNSQNLVLNSNSENHFDTEYKNNNLPKRFNCQELKQSLFKKYELRQTPYRKTLQGSRKSRTNLDAWIKEEQQDTRYNENLLSPDPQQECFKEMNSSIRKSIIRKSNSHNSRNISKQNSNQVSALKLYRKTVHFSPKKISQRKSQFNSSHKSLNKDNQFLSNKKSMSNGKSARS